MSVAGDRQIRILKPVLHAYVLAYLSSTGPSVIRISLALIRGTSKADDVLIKTRQILRKALGIHRFPAFCAVLVALSTSLQGPFRLLLGRAGSRSTRLLGINLSQALIAQLARFFAALVAASISFALLNGNTTTSAAGYAKKDESSEPSDGNPVIDNSTTSLKELQRVTSKEVPEQIPPVPAQAMTSDVLNIPSDALAGKTIDLTLVAFTRAADIILSYVWNSTGPHFRHTNRIAGSTTPLLFSLSVATIMHAWFYAPHALPQTYVRWISAAAELDPRLLLALRQARYGNWVYGRDTGLGSLLGSMAVDHGIPFDAGDPAKTIPVACEIVHSGSGKSCEVHAIVRFWRGWLFAARMYGPLQLVVLLRRLQSGRLKSHEAKADAISRASVDVARSSAFLGAFISLFYYGVCLGRTRLGPRLFSSKTVSPQMWDSGLCVLTGCLACGWSILVEQERRRSELMFFVLPRALSAWFPRRYLREHRWKEHLTFSFSTALVLAAVQERPEAVRGLLGGVLSQVLT